jgi:hypothetical protein
MKLQLLASSAAAVAATSATSAAAAVVSKDDVSSSFGSALRSLIGVSFSEQAEDAIEAFIEGDEGEPNKEKNSPMHKKGSKHDSRSDPSNKSNKKSGRYSVTEGMCNPDTTKPERLAICEDIWLTLCNPDDEFEVDDEYCDWLGFTANVDWVASEDFDSVLAYKKWDDGEESQKTKKKTSSAKGNAKTKGRGGFKEGMCDPSNDIKPEHEDICEDVWFTMCNPDDETEVDDEYCDWLGFTADVEWYDVGEDLDYLEMKDLIYYEDSYDSSEDSDDRHSRKNLRG